MNWQMTQQGGTKITHQDSLITHSSSLCASKYHLKSFHRHFFIGFIMSQSEKHSFRKNEGGRGSCIRKQQIWPAMCSDPAGCDSLPAPICCNSSCCVHGGKHDSCWCTAQARAVTSPLLACLHKLYTSLIYYFAPQTPDATYTVAGSTDTVEIQLCSLDASKQLCGTFCTRGA